ncbi:SDR family NAD(P)-dependent oxidoreductase [Ottowia sp. VDI28]|uniref:SDR family NAD(P)-dependent oxidoreductase n=1 Tax=Ottowia sp. VDI28 TaxID=3133968 RepID=UPI003C3042F2
MSSSHSSPLPTLLLVGAQYPLAADVLERLKQDGYEAHAIEGGSDAALQSVLGKLPNIDVLVTVTPTALSHKEFEAITDDDFGAALESQLLAVVRTAQAVLPQLRAGARIVHVSSRGHQGAWGGVHHMAAAAGLVSMTRSMALELEPEGICVNIVGGEFEHERQDTPRNRQAVAHAVSSFAAAGAGITGQCVVVDGLTSLRMNESRRPRLAPSSAS